MARSSRASPMIVDRNPIDIAISGTATPTTPAMPMIITRELPRRSGIERRLAATSAKVCRMPLTHSPLSQGEGHWHARQA